MIDSVYVATYYMQSGLGSSSRMPRKEEGKWSMRDKYLCGGHCATMPGECKCCNRTTMEQREHAARHPASLAVHKPSMPYKPAKERVREQREAVVTHVRGGAFVGAGTLGLVRVAAAKLHRAEHSLEHDMREVDQIPGRHEHFVRFTLPAEREV